MVEDGSFVEVPAFIEGADGLREAEGSRLWGILLMRSHPWTLPRWNIDDFKILCIVGHDLSGPERTLEDIFACRIRFRGLNSLATCILPRAGYNLEPRRYDRLHL